MTAFPKHKDVVFISQLKVNEITRGRRVEHVLRSHKKSLEELVSDAAAARHILAGGFMNEGNKLLTLQPAMCRLAVTRFYYSMYQNMRSVAYIAYGGDDHEAHSVLHTKEIAGFNPTLDWRSILKNARLERNAADYECFPLDDAEFRPIAIGLQGNAASIDQACDVYLKSKGVKI